MYIILMGVAAKGHDRSPPVAVQEEATIGVNLGGECIVHHRPYGPKVYWAPQFTYKSICN
jgi:hypothetical protein